MKNIPKLSITKNKAWSLILDAKYTYKGAKDARKTITIKNNIFHFVYSFEQEKIIKKNFSVDKETQELFNIFLPIVLNRKKNPYIVGHLAQSLDGFIATRSGESKYISCKQNIEHIHRIRAISDVILVGARTILLDNPCLTTRLVKGNNPMRLILDPNNKLKGVEKVFKHHDKNGFRIIGSNELSKEENIFKLPIVKNTFKLNHLIDLFKKLNKK